MKKFKLEQQIQKSVPRISEPRSIPLWQSNKDFIIPVYTPMMNPLLFVIVTLGVCKL